MERNRRNHIPGGFIVPLPREDVVSVTQDIAPSPVPVIDRTGRENYSTTELARKPDHRRKVKEGMEERGMGSTFIEDPASLVATTLNRRNKNGLTDQQRIVLELRYNDGLSQVQVGEVLGKTYKTVSKIERRALQKLQKMRDGGSKNIEQAQILLAQGMLDLNMVPGLSSREREIVRRRCITSQSNIEAANEMGLPVRRTSESYRVAIQKVAMFVREFKTQAQQTHQSEQ